MSKKSPEVVVTVANFDSRVGDVYRVKRDAVPLSEWTPYTTADFVPHGGTPLLDATARFISHLETQRNAKQVIVGLLCDESGSMNGLQKSVVDGVNEFVGSLSGVEAVDPESAGKVIAVIMTDGGENSSQEVTKEKVAALISKSEADGWTFIYMGANQDAWDEASSTLGFSGAATASSINFVATPQGMSSAMGNVRSRTASYLSSNSGYVATMDSLGANQSSIAEDGTVTNKLGEDVTDSITTGVGILTGSK